MKKLRFAIALAALGIAGQAQQAQAFEQQCPGDLLSDNWGYCVLVSNPSICYSCNYLCFGDNDYHVIPSCETK